MIDLRSGSGAGGISSAMTWVSAATGVAGDAGGNTSAAVDARVGVGEGAVEVELIDADASAGGVAGPGIEIGSCASKGASSAPATAACARAARASDAAASFAGSKRSAPPFASANAAPSSDLRPRRLLRRERSGPWGPAVPSLSLAGAAGIAPPAKVASALSPAPAPGFDSALGLGPADGFVNAPVNGASAATEAITAGDAAKMSGASAAIAVLVAGISSRGTRPSRPGRFERPPCARLCADGAGESS
jgi:hypothetical protein